MITQVYSYHFIISGLITLIALWIFYAVNRPPQKTSPAYILIFGLVQLGVSLYLIQYYTKATTSVEVVEELATGMARYFFFTACWFTGVMVIKKGIESLDQTQRPEKSEENALINM